MLKLRIALCLALVVGTLTVTTILHGARPMTIVYRAVISIILFGFIGYGVGIIAERFLKVLLKEDSAEQEHAINIANEQQTIDELGELPNESTFSPFTSNNFEQIPRPKE